MLISIEFFLRFFILKFYTCEFFSLAIDWYSGCIFKWSNTTYKLIILIFYWWEVESHSKLLINWMKFLFFCFTLLRRNFWCDVRIFFWCFALRFIMTKGWKILWKKRNSENRNFIKHIIFPVKISIDFC